MATFIWTAMESSVGLQQGKSCESLDEWTSIARMIVSAENLHTID